MRRPGLHIPNIGDMIKKLQHVLSGGLNSITNAVTSALHTITGAEQSALNNVKGAGHTIVASIQDEGHKAVGAVQDAASKAEGEIKGTFSEAFAAAAAKALTVAMAVLDASTPDQLQVQLGPLGLVWDGNVPHAGDIQGWVTKPPTSRSETLALIDHLGPTQVFAAADAELSELFVTSSDEGVAVQATWETANFMKDAAKIIAAF